MNFNFRKVSAVIASAVMVGSSLGFAAASNYPAPFVQNGASSVAVVYGANANIDLVAVSGLVTDLQTRLSAGSTSTTSGASATGGDSINLATSSRKLYFNDSLSVPRSSLTKSEMATVLADGSFTDLTGTAYSYTQTITPGNTVVTYGTSGGNLNDPTLYLAAGTSSALPLYNYTLSFGKNVQVNDSTNVQGQKIKILGVDYVIGAGSTNANLYLYGAGTTATVEGGETKTVSVAGKEHAIQLISTSSSTEAKLSVDGTTKTVTKGSKYQFPGGVVVYIQDVTHPAFAGDVRNVQLIIGANTLRLQNASTVKQGADETSVQNTYVSLTQVASESGKIAGFNVGVALQKSGKDYIAAGETLVDPVFGGLSLQFVGPNPGLNDSSRERLKVNTDNDHLAFVTFTSARSGSAGEVKLQYVYDNDTTTTGTNPVLAWTNVNTANSKGIIHVYEGEDAKISDEIVVNQGDAGVILKVESIDTESPSTGQAKVRFTDVISGDYTDQTLTNDSGGTYSRTGVSMFGGTGYTIRANQSVSGGTVVNVTWSSAATTRTLFPRIKLKSGGWIAFLAQTTVANGTNVIFPDGLTTLATTGSYTSTRADIGPGNAITTNSVWTNGINWTLANDTSVAAGGLNNSIILGINRTFFASSTSGNTLGGYCNFNSTLGPAILFLEPKKWDDSSYGSPICIPLTTTGTKEIAIGDALANGTWSGYLTYGSDSQKKAAVDKYGSFITVESRTNENGVDTVTYSPSQMYLDVLFTAQGATVTPGSTTSTGGTLGNVIVKDSEVSAVQDKNLVVVGGSCINSVAAKLLGSTSPLCGADFSAKTSVGSGQFLIQSFGDAYTKGKIALLVAGYEAYDTSNAAMYLKSGKVDTTAGNTYIGKSATDATLQTTKTA